MESSNVNRFILSTHNIGVVVLAAGASTRMGGTASKMLLPLADGRPMLAHTLDHVRLLQPLEAIVVVRPDLLPNTEALVQPPARVVVNKRFAEGMGTSLAAGVSALTNAVEACLVLLGDEPFVPGPVVERLVGSYLQEHGQITIPVYGDQPGPPTLFARKIFPALSVLEGDTGGRQLLARFQDSVVRVPFNASDRPKDIDTPEDYCDAASVDA